MDFSVEPAELVDLVGDWALTFAAAAYDLVRLPAFTGRWRITEIYEWDEIDLAGSAHITFSGKDHGELAFLAPPARR